MRPQQPLLTSGIRGYVCRSCISKLQNSLQPRPLWLVRNTTRKRALGTKTPSARKDVHKLHQKRSEPVIKYWEQDGEGNRRESPFQDPEVLARVEKAMLGEDFDPGSLLEVMDEGIPGKEEDQEDEFYDNIEQDFREQLSESMAWSPEEQSKVDATEVRVNAMESEMQRLRDVPDLKNLSKEERLRIRQEVLAGVPELEVQQTQMPSFPSIPDQTFPIETLPIQQVSSVAEVQSLTTSPSTRADTLNAEEFPEAYRSSIQRLNSSLQLCSRNLEENKLGDVAQKTAWESFLLCRKCLSEAPEKVPTETWSLLWDIFERPGVKNFGRMEHIYLLGRYMKKHDIPFQPLQHILFIESKFIRGYQEKAIREWEEAEASLGKNNLSFKSYWELGVRMYAQNGDGEKALDAVATYFSESDHNVDFRLLIPVIRGFLLMSTHDGQNRAWRVYEALRSNLGSDMTMEDFDKVTALFLDADLPERALDVFKDLMLAGEKPQRTSIAQDLANGKSLVQKLRVRLDLEDSQTLAALPPHLNNKFFFGKWIKKLIGEGHLDAAKKVLDLMGVRGIRPDAKYMNGLIGAFYRDGPLGKQQLAEDLAWKMIAARLEFVKARDTKYQLEAPAQISKSLGKPDFKDPSSLRPRATIETFSILIKQYRQRQKQNIIPDLLDTLQRAKIPPNTYFMNQLIMTNVRYQAGQGAWAWDTYSSLVRKQNVPPDYDTFTYLWVLMRRASDPVTASQGRGYIDCRTLFSEMIKCANGPGFKEPMPREVYDMIILSFSLSNDQAGTAVALRALHGRFGILPNEVTVRTIIHQLAKIGLLDKYGQPVKRLETKKSRTRKRVNQVTKVLATFQQRQSEALLEKGVIFEELIAEEKLEQSLNIVTDLLKFVTQERLQAGAYEGGHKNVTDISKEAAASMGVEDCDPWAVTKGEDQGLVSSVP